MFTITDAIAAVVPFVAPTQAVWGRIYKAVLAIVTSHEVDRACSQGLTWGRFQQMFPFHTQVTLKAAWLYIDNNA